jgi:hypothetical protein
LNRLCRIDGALEIIIIIEWKFLKQTLLSKVEDEKEQGREDFDVSIASLAHVKKSTSYLTQVPKQ